MSEGTGSERQGSFDQLTVKRLNLVAEDGTLRLVMSSGKDFPDPVVGGESFPRDDAPYNGFLFYNELGDECGGLVWGASRDPAQPSAGAALLFDRYRQDQTVGLSYAEAAGEVEQGLTVWDRPAAPVAEAIARIRATPIEERAAVRDSIDWGTQRLFVGRGPAGPTVCLSDSRGRERLRLLVDVHDVPRIEFLDENGEVTFRFPPT